MSTLPHISPDGPSPLGAQESHEIQFVEDFVLAEDREKTLETLIPGTDIYYFYQSLHLQNTEQHTAVQRVLNSWRQRHGETRLYKEIRNRQMLLTYSKNPKQTLDFLIDELDPKLNHQRERLQSKPQLPNSLGAKLVDFDLIKSKLLRNSKTLEGFSDLALHRLRAEELSPEQRRQLLSRLRVPTHPQLLDMILEDLKFKGSRGFGSLPIHSQLTISQLEQLGDRQPSLRNETKYVNAYIRKLQPNPDIDWQNDAEEHQAYLQRLWRFVQDLSPAHNSLKAMVLYNWLEFDESQGKYDRDRFRTYLELPRPSFYVAKSLMESNLGRRYAADLNLQLGECLLPPVRNDEPLVKRYLLEFFRRDANHQSFAPFVQDDYLKRVFAESKITHGLGNPENWYSLISPNEYKELKDRVDIDFVPTNPEIYGTTDTVSLEVVLKNVDKLLVKVYEVNTQNFYRDLSREVNTDISLDGLIPNESLTFQYDESPFLRHKRTFEFPQLAQPGVYVVDFIGNGKSSRAVIRKGQLTYLAETTPHGHVFRVLNDQHEVVPEASLWLGGQHFKSDDGKILVPYSTQPGRQPIVLSAGNLASLQYFYHQREDYHLSVATYIDRESLLDRRDATILLRPQLLLNNTPVSPKVLEDVVVTVKSTNLDGIQSTKQFDDVVLSDSQATPVQIAVPGRLAKLRVELSGTITDHRQRTRTYQASHEVAINKIDASSRIEDAHLSKIGDQYLLQLLGKNGEPRPHRAVDVQLQHEAFQQARRAQLATDEHGMIQLGTLNDITSVSVDASTIEAKQWTLQRDRRTPVRKVHAMANTRVRIPHMLSDVQLDLDPPSLFELRGGSVARELTNDLAVQPNFLEVKRLAPGDYQLRIGREVIQISVTQNVVNQDAENEDATSSIDRFAVGSARRLELPRLKPLQITDTIVNGDQLEVRLANDHEFARVHIYATRFLPAFDPYEALANIATPSLEVIRTPPSKSFYAEGRKLGDELKYVLDRAYAQKFPGNMLERPSLLLNSWPINDTQTSTKDAAAGGEFDAADAEAAPMAANSVDMKQAKAEPPSDFANLDFLSQTSSLVMNLKPDPQGVIRIPLEQLGKHQHLHIVATDPLTTVYRQHSLPTLDSEHRNLRLANGLASDKHYTQKKVTSLLATGEKFQLADTSTSDFDTYDSLRRVLDLYVTSSGNATLNKFAWIVDWPTLTTDAKRAKYSEFACHELHFFLYQKDSDFFREVIQPYLENKHHKTFLDEYLLERDLSRYLEPWNFAQLNTVERILLSDRLPNEVTAVQRLIADQLDLVPIDLTRQATAFETALGGRSLDRGLAANPKRSLMLRRKQRETTTRGMTQRFSLGDKSIQVEERLAESAGLEASYRGRASFANDGVDFFAAPGLASAGRRQLFEQLDKTKEWAETNYYQLPIAEQVADLVTPDAFWLDYAKRDRESPFFSIHWPSATRSFPEMMFALSVLDLPFDSAEHETKFEDAAMTLTAASPMVVFHQQIQETKPASGQSPILIQQNYFRADDRYTMVQGQRQDKFVDANEDEFLAHTVYGCQVVLTNPTSTPRQVDVLQQIPHHAIATNGGQATSSLKVELQPYHTQTVEYFFYFPESGEFEHFPAHVTEGETLLGHATPNLLNVVETLSRVDEASWEYVSQFSSDEEVLGYLKSHNLLEIDLAKIAFRMAKKGFFGQAIELLRNRHVYHHELWAYALKHRDVKAIATYLQHSKKFLDQCGAHLDSELVQVEPVVRRTYQHLDYKPLVNARAHQLGDRRSILNNRFHQQYHRMLHVLKYQPTLTHEDRISLTYYLLLQDRIPEAQAMFAEVDRSQIEAKLQYDYFAAYLDCFEEEPDVARAIVGQYENYPIPGWQVAFASVKSMLDELDGKDVTVSDPKNQIQSQTEAASAQSSFDFLIEGSTVKLNSQNLQEFRVNYYLVDLELLFSRTPFVQNFDGQFAHIRPNDSQVVQLPGQKNDHDFELPQDLQNRNVLVEIEADGITRSRLHSSNSLTVQMSENYGQLKVVDTKVGKRLPKIYVKVYAEDQGGNVAFYKDGYTDLRGRFDYASLSTNQLDRVKRFSILVIDEERGGLVREARVPKR